VSWQRGQTLVIQSFHDRPPVWVRRCMASVRAWAEGAGFGYRAMGDEIFDHLPRWVRRKTARRASTATDLARLHALDAALDEGWARVIWLDADVYIIDGAGLTAELRPEDGYLLGRESWVQPDKRGRLQVYHGVHNAIVLAEPGNALLSFHEHAAMRILARHEGEMVPQLIGPKFLTALDNMMGLPASWAVNMASPLVVRDIAAGGGPARDRLLARSKRVPAALNLCHSHAGRETDGVQLDDRTLDEAVTRLERDGLR